MGPDRLPASLPASGLCNLRASGPLSGPLQRNEDAGLADPVCPEGLLKKKKSLLLYLRDGGGQGGSERQVG